MRITEYICPQSNEPLYESDFIHMMDATELFTADHKHEYILWWRGRYLECKNSNITYYFDYETGRHSEYGIMDLIPMPAFSGVGMTELVNYDKGSEKGEININLNDILLPTIMKVADSSIALNLTSVQPLPYPNGQLFYLDYTYKKQNWIQKIFYKLKKWINKIFKIKDNGGKHKRTCF